ncbi:MAG: hypothetical protein PUC12_14710 [Clostridiales bacterium]|nr:hypothetical protein [Clostridiales bacterium]
MKDNVCRAITFINYHIPIRWDSNISVQYSTVGFFDGLFTKRININYEEDDLKPLWQHTSRLTAENEGYYSYQNIFGFSRDTWNNISDEIFWNKSTDEDYPLTFVVFLQIRDYLTDAHTIESQCRAFSNVIDEKLRGIGKAYTYGTIDKNDFVVCIKSKKYENAVGAIKALHDAGVNVVYSYTIFSVNNEVLKNLNEDKYRYLSDEIIPSICLKGIVNSFETGSSIALDRKYRQFCDILIQRLYGDDDPSKKIEEDKNKVLYDILGDNDFRLIARNVPLRKILREYAPGGILCYTEQVFPYYLFSSSLVLNTCTGKKEEIEDSEIKNAIEMMRREFTCHMCDNLSEQMEGILEVVKKKSLKKEDRVISICQAIFQLLQSLKVLEEAPTKKYDFYSLYLPLESLVQILESKIHDPDIGNVKMIYEFIHKISMTLHGTLRTDIQFFQIRDFNVIVHYAPAKIRAFYALWAMKIRDFYKKFVLEGQSSPHEYSFILAPGMYKGTAVRQLFENSQEEKRLMLITLPERHIYSPRWITIVLAHEVSHFVGSGIRNRKERHTVWLRLIARILELELQALFYRELLCISHTEVMSAYKKNPDLLTQIEDQLIKTEEKIRRENEDKKEYIFHSKQSIEIIMESYRKFLVYYIEQILTNFSCNIKYFISDSRKKNSIKASEEDIRIVCNRATEDMKLFCNEIGKVVFAKILNLFHVLTSETFADIMAILTLELSLEDYIRSFLKTELGEHEGEIREDNTITFIDVRIAIVVETISGIFSGNPNTRLYFSNYSNWINNPIRRLKTAKTLTVDERKILEAVSMFLKKKCALSSKINCYNAIYDSSSRSFKGSNSDFLRDEKVFDLICGYLRGCAKLYIEKVVESKDVEECRNDILKTYRNISKKTEIDLMEEIENFLSGAESEYANKKFSDEIFGC